SVGSSSAALLVLVGDGDSPIAGVISGHVSVYAATLWGWSKISGTAMGILGAVQDITGILDHLVNLRALVVFILLSGPAGAAEQTLEAENVTYEVESRLTETTAGSCLIRASSLSTKRPEFFNFRSGVWVGKPNGALYTGFTLDVGNLVY